MKLDRKKVNRVSLAVIVISAVIIFGLQLTYQGSAYEGLTLVPEGWTYQGREVTLPLAVHPKVGNTYVIERTLPENYNQTDVVIFKSEGIFWRLYVNGRLLDSFLPGEVAPSATAGEHWNIIMLPAGTEGGRLRIEMDIPCRFGAGLIREVFYANHNFAGESLVRSFIYALMLAVFTMALAIAATVGNMLLVVDSPNEDKSICYLGLFAVCMVVWTLMDSPVIGILYGVRCEMLVAKYVAMALALGFATIYFMSIGRFPKTWYSRLITAIPFGCAVIYPLLDLTHTVSFADSAVFSGIMFLGLLVIAMWSSLRLMHRRYYGKDSSILIAVGNVFLFAVAILDIYQTFVIHGNDNTGNTRVAMVVYLTVVSVDRLMDLAEDRKKLEEARLVSKMAYIDGLTNIANRMAFNKKLSTLEKSPSSAFVSFDVNNLKTANDNFGHLEGDDLICLAADCIRESFTDIGTVYRYGGDEFFVICEDFDSEKLERAISVLEEKIDQVNEAKVLHVELAIARGYAAFAPDLDSSLTDTLNRADENMYANKIAMKGEGNIR